MAKDNLLKPSIQMRNKGDLSDFDRGMVVGMVWGAVDLLGFFPHNHL